MKKPSFIAPILLIIITLSNIDTFSQDVWEDPQAITDSISDNSNPCLTRSNGHTYIFYEKTNDEGVSSIFMQDDLYLHQEIALFSDEIINYRNPQIINFGSYWGKDDVDFILLLESDMESTGVFNIYYTEFNYNEGFSELIALSVPDGISCEQMKAQGLNVAWKKGVELKYCIYNYSEFGVIQTLDNGDANEINVGNSSIAFKKNNIDHIELYYSEKSNSGDYFNIPESIFIGNVSSLNVLYSDFHDLNDYGLLYEYNYDGLYHLLTFDDYDGIDTLEILQDSSLQPTAISYEVMVDNLYPYFQDLAVRKIINGNADIFASYFWSPENLANISNSEFEESNPKLFYYYNQSYNVVLFYQSKRNNHEQLFFTKRTFWVGINEKTNNINTNIYPNPASSKISIHLDHDIHQKISIDILDLNGRNISRLFEGDIPENGIIDFDLPGQLINGTYFIRVNNRDRTDFEKLFISK